MMIHHRILPSVQPTHVHCQCNAIGNSRSRKLASLSSKPGVLRLQNTALEDKLSVDVFSDLPVRCGNWGVGAVNLAQTALHAKEEGKNKRRTASEETLDLLEWPRLCAAVAEFASTEMGRNLCHALTVPSKKEESEALLDETSAAVEIDSLLPGVLEFGCIKTALVKRGLERASKGAVCTGEELIAIATILQSSQTLQRAVMSALQENIDRRNSLQPVAKVVEVIVVPHDIGQEILRKVDQDGIVMDTASAQLRQARIEAQTLEQRVQELLNKLVGDNSGANDTREIVDVDGRLCLMVASDRLQSIPGLLFQRGSGVAAYLEPSAAVSLNNKLFDARTKVRKAEYEVLLRITKKVVPHLNDIEFMLDTVVHLDMIMARAKYGLWIGSSKPLFSNSNNSVRSHIESTSDKEALESDQVQHNFINLRRIRHPLLVEQHSQAVRNAREKLKSKKKVLNKMKVRASTSTDVLKEMEEQVANLENEVATVEARKPVPIDVQIGFETRVVTITGPNTGGKTSAIKTVGLAAIMAKAGLFVVALDPVTIPWFDTVLADIGDEQSLSQSLSTFSGHLQRIKRIKAESTGDSLVLLDEVGAGTDPTEGTALGMAILESFAKGGIGGSLLTIATTHHGGLKTLKYSDSRFENASIEFDEKRLAPTYKLLWGIPGRSNAMNIARRLGLASEILADAESLYGAESVKVNEIIMKLEEAKLDYERCLEESERLFLENKRLHKKLTRAAESLHDHMEELHVKKWEQLATISGSSRSRLGAIGRSQTRRVPETPPDNPAVTSRVIPRGGETVMGSTSAAKLQSEQDTTAPHIGQLVYIPKLGRAVKVVEVDKARKEITVQSGQMQIKVKLKEFQ